MHGATFPYFCNFKMEGMAEEKTRVLFIINPAAGLKRERDLQGIIRGNLDTERFEYDIKVTARPGDAREYALQGVEKGCSIIAAVGGDGTINEIASGIEGADAALAVVPNGSGNGLARHLNIPLDIPEAIRCINHHKVSLIDTASLNGHIFVSVAGVGFDARVASLYRKARRRGFYGYFRIVVKEFLRYKEHRYQVEIDGKRLERDAFFISISNSNQFGYGTVIAPSARLDDGVLNVSIVRKIPLSEMPHTLQQLFTLRIDRSPYVETHTGSRITILRDDSKWVNIDGEAIREEPMLQIISRPGTLKVALPEISSPGHDIPLSGRG